MSGRDPVGHSCDERINALVDAVAVLLEAVEGLPNTGLGRRLRDRMRAARGRLAAARRDMDREREPPC